MVQFETECGSFEIELNVKNAPLSSAYFRSLVEAGAFNGSSFFRITSEENASIRSENPIEILQGGLKDSDPQPLAPIAHESTAQTGLQHTAWTISLARFEPGRTYGSFFICMRDEPELDFNGRRHPDGQGFAAFGRVSSGRDTLRHIFERREEKEFLASPVTIDVARISRDQHKGISN